MPDYAAAAAYACLSPSITVSHIFFIIAAACHAAFFAAYAATLLRQFSRLRLRCCRFSRMLMPLDAAIFAFAAAICRMQQFCRRFFFFTLMLLLMPPHAAFISITPCHADATAFDYAAITMPDAAYFFASVDFSFATSFRHDAPLCRYATRAMLSLAFDTYYLRLALFDADAAAF